MSRRIKVYKFLSICLIIVLFYSSTVFADQVIMDNGDRLTGKIVKKEGDSIVLETKSAGQVKIRWSSIVRIIADEPLSLTLEDGKILEGKIELAENTLKVKKANEEKVELQKKALKVVRTLVEQAKFEAEQKRIQDSRLMDFWSGAIDAGFSLTTGNSDTRTFTFGMRGIRETAKHKFTVYTNVLQVSSLSSGKRTTTAQSVWSGVRQDININRKWFAYGAGDFEYNKPQKLNTRLVLGGGAGYYAIKKDKTNLNITFGGTNNYENFSTGLVRNSAEGSVGQEFRHQFSPRIKLSERFIFYPNVSNLGEFRAVFDGSIQTDINSWLGMHLTVGNRYNSQPVSLTKNNDFQLSTGLRVSFGKNRRK